MRPKILVAVNTKICSPFLVENWFQEGQRKARRFVFLFFPPQPIIFFGKVWVNSAHGVTDSDTE